MVKNFHRNWKSTDRAPLGTGLGWRTLGAVGLGHGYPDSVLRGRRSNFKHPRAELASGWRKRGRSRATVWSETRWLLDGPSVNEVSSDEACYARFVVEAYYVLLDGSFAGHERLV